MSITNNMNMKIKINTDNIQYPSQVHTTFIAIDGTKNELDIIGVINNRSFDFNNISEIIIGTHVTSIACNTFYECTKLKSIFIPDSIRSCGFESFDKCSDILNIYGPNITKAHLFDNWYSYNFTLIYTEDGKLLSTSTMIEPGMCIRSIISPLHLFKSNVE